MAKAKVTKSDIDADQQVLSDSEGDLINTDVPTEVAQHVCDHVAFKESATEHRQKAKQLKEELPAIIREFGDPTVRYNVMRPGTDQVFSVAIETDEKASITKAKTD